MKILLMADYPVGVEVCKYLKAHNENIVGIVTHPQKYQKNTKEILDILSLPEEAIIDGSELCDEATVSKIKACQPDIILCIFWALLLPEKIISIPPKGCINFHCSYLPYNKGKNPNVWPIIDQTPAGVTLHYIDTGIDSGDIITQQRVAVTSTDTAKTLYHKLERAFITLFTQTWPSIKDGTNLRLPQEGEGTFHYAKDFRQLDQIELDKTYTGQELINILRARTFSPHPSAYFMDGDKKVYVRIDLTLEDHSNSED